MSDSVRRVGRNEAMFRNVNERVEGLDDVVATTGAMTVVCECGRVSCVERVEVAVADQREVDHW